MVTGQLQGNANLVSQTQVDNLLMKFITEGLMPFSLVEQPAFKEFVTGLQPNRTVMCRATLVKKISEKASQVKRNLRTAMDKVDYIATTTDCWSARRRSYIGVTAHWIDSETLQRKSCVLACRRLMGKHTFDLLAARLEDIHTEFEIRSKVVKTTTDNGSNFVKAFSVFSVSSNSEEDNSDEAEDPGENGSFENVFDDLTEASKGLEYQLPPHHRCSAHTLNLISTVDADKAEADPSYKRLSRSTFAKCQALWNNSSRSPQAAEKVKELCGLNLIKPNATRWNSVFMSVQRLNRIIKEKGENVVHNVCLVLEVSKLKPAEIAFLKDYEQVMKPVAQALNILQGETNHSNAYMGYLAPTITILRDKISKKLDIPAVKPLVQALLNGIDRRFESILEDRQVIAAAILHPKFKEDWTSDNDVIEKGVAFINEKLESLMQPGPDNNDENHLNQDSSASDDKDDYDFFQKKNKVTSDASCLRSFLDSPVENLSDYSRWPQLRKLFIELNTPLPASAACERLFSSGGLLFRPHRSSMTDKNFENSLLVKCNKDFI